MCTYLNGHVEEEYVELPRAPRAEQLAQVAHTVRVRLFTLFTLTTRLLLLLLLPIVLQLDVLRDSIVTTTLRVVSHHQAAGAGPDNS